MLKNLLRCFFTLSFVLFCGASVAIAAEEQPQQPTPANANTAPAVVDHEAVPPPQGKVPSNLLALGNGEYFSPYALVVEKATRTLTVWKNQDGTIQLVGAYPTDMGKQPGNKHSLGDSRTPEGIYFFQEKLEGAKLKFDEYGEKAFTMDYPNFFDRLAKKTGYGIWLHAIPETKTLQRGSKGCVVVRNKVIEALSQVIGLKTTPIIVVDKIDFHTPEEHKAAQQKALSWLESWRSSWETKKLEDYITFYADSFRGQGMNKKQWRDYKNRLNSQYEYIQVKLLNPIMLSHKEGLITRFIQQYSSNRLSDSGEKNLYVSNGPSGKLEILAEDWQALRKDLVATH